MKEKFRKFLFPTEDDTFLKDTTLNQSAVNNYEPTQSYVNNPRIPKCTVSDFDEDDITPNNENRQNKVFNPTSFNETEAIAKEIINGNNVIVNLEDLLSLENGPKIAKRIIDFLCGTSFACKVSVKRINDSTFIFSK